MTPIDIFVTFVNTFGPWLGLLVFIVGGTAMLTFFIVRGWFTTRFYVQRTTADTQNRVAEHGAQTETNLAQAILKLAETLTKNNEQASVERQETFKHLERMTGRLEGLATALTLNTKASGDARTAIGDLGLQLDEFGGRLKDIPQMKTDLEGLARSAETFTKGYGPDLDTRIAPLLALMTTTNSAINSLSSTALDMAKDMARAIEILIIINEYIKGEAREPLQAQSE